MGRSGAYHQNDNLVLLFLPLSNWDCPSRPSKGHMLCFLPAAFCVGGDNGIHATSLVLLPCTKMRIQMERVSSSLMWYKGALNSSAFVLPTKHH